MGKILDKIQSAKNFLTTRPQNAGNIPLALDAKSPQAKKNLSDIISPVMLQRLKQDIKSWRDAIYESEQAWYPHRVKMQQIFIDTILNGHVYSLMERRKDLTLLRDFKVCDDKGEPNEEWTAYFQQAQWFELFQAYSLDALFFGYSLISLGDMQNDGFPDISIVRRWNVSPDRLNVTKLVYSLQGTEFLDEPWADWHIWVPTQSETGASNCGFGLFYKIALYEIFLRNTLGFNGDFVELFSQPYRLGKTTKTTASERNTLEQALQQMGSSGYAILDTEDSIQFLETKLGGEGWKGYENFEKRLVGVVSKIVLGHENAMSEIPGKLGAGQDEDNPVHEALVDKQTKDGKFQAHVTNTQLFPKLRKLGINIPEELHFEYVNDEEKESLRAKEDASNLATADIFLAISQAGGDPDWGYFTERTGITVTKTVAPKPVSPLLPQVKARLEKLYSKKHNHKHE